MNKDSNDSTTLIFKSIPKEIEDLTNLLNSLKIPAQQIKPFGRKRALIIYEHKNAAEQALKKLKDLEFSGKPVNISLFCQDKPKENKKEKTKLIIRKTHKSVQTSLETQGGTAQIDSLSQQQINKYVQKLYAIEGDLDFDQPPLPYLKYSYPPINKDILDNICIFLLSNKRFYTQVLHLMNRMNLEPPFVKRNYKFTSPGIPIESSTQTEEVIIKEVLTLTNTGEKIEDEEEIESELESSEDDVLQKKRQNQVKRKLPDQEAQYKKKARQMLQNVQKLNKEIENKKTTNTHLSVKEIFDTQNQSSTAATNKIELNLKRNAPPKVKYIKETPKSSLNLPLDLKTQKLSPDEMESLNIFKNYEKGLASNKLYIKNLHKDVAIEDLRLIYQRYLKDNFELDIKVMQHGRMKGQGFVTFIGDQREIIQTVIEQALEDTNGFILRDKPMVVCYGKQS